MNIGLFWYFNYSLIRLAVYLCPLITAKWIRLPTVIVLLFSSVISTSPRFFNSKQPNSTSLAFRFQWAAYPACLLLTLGVAKSLPTNVPHQSDSDRHIKMQIPASLLTAILSHSLSWEAPTREGIRCWTQGLNIQTFPWVLLKAATIYP